MTNDEIPCEICLVVPMCKSRILKRKESYIRFSNYSIWRIVKEETSDCPQLCEYILPNESYNYNISHRRQTVIFFTGIDLGE